MTTPDDTATGAGPWPSAGSDGDWWSGEPGPDAGPSGDKRTAMPRPDAVRPYDATLRPAAEPRPGTVVRTTSTEAAPSPVDDAAPATVDEPPARTGPFDEPPRVRSTPPRKPAGVRPPRPIAPMLRRTPLPPPVDAFSAPPAPAHREDLDEPEFLDLAPAPVTPVRSNSARLIPRLTLTMPRPVQPSPKQPRSPWLAMPGLLVLMLLAAFLGWVSAEPFWLSLGHGEAGTVTVLSSGSVCQGSFTATDFTVSTVDIAGLSGGGCRVGAVHPARMVSAAGTQAYVASDRGLLMRWGIGFALVLVCGFALAWVLGAYRLTGGRRLIAIATSLAAPYAVVVALVISFY